MRFESVLFGKLGAYEGTTIIEINNAFEQSVGDSRDSAMLIVGGPLATLFASNLEAHSNLFELVLDCCVQFEIVLAAHPCKLVILVLYSWLPFRILNKMNFEEVLCFSQHLHL